MDPSKRRFLLETIILRVYISVVFEGANVTCRETYMYYLYSLWIIHHHANTVSKQFLNLSSGPLCVSPSLCQSPRFGCWPSISPLKGSKPRIKARTSSSESERPNKRSNDRKSCCWMMPGKLHAKGAKTPLVVGEVIYKQPPQPWRIKLTRNYIEFDAGKAQLVSCICWWTLCV